MLCAKYDYKMDIAVKQEEAYEKGKNEKGKNEKAVEAATNLLKMNVLTPEQIVQAEGLPLEQVLQLKEELSES
jgi:predicted transposase YdaD